MNTATGYLPEIEAVQADYQAVAAVPPRISPGLVFFLVRLADAAMLLVTGLATALLTFHGTAFMADALIAGAPGAAMIIWRSAPDGGELLLSLHRQLGRLLPRLALGMLVTGVLLVALRARGSVPFLWLSAWMILAILAFLGTRAAIVPMLRRWRDSGRMLRQVAVVGATDVARDVIDRLESDARSLARIVGLFDDAPSAAGVAVLPVRGRDVPVLGGVSALRGLVRRERIDAVIIAHPYAMGADVAAVCQRLRGLVADVYVATDMDSLRPAAGAPDWLADLPLIALVRHRLCGWQALLKATFDRLVGLLALAVLSPLLLGIAILIKLDSSGPVLFRQPRVGLNNRTFVVFKFRSMFHTMRDLRADRQTSRNDPRVTRVGRVLRKLSLDELPQLLNVLRGDMSLVGPRPHTPATKADGLPLNVAEPQYSERHQVKPGITGWAQVNGARGEIRTVEQIRERVRLDLEYIERWSFALDIRILLLTVWREILSPRAF